VKRPLFTGLVGLLVLACTACGGGAAAKQAAGKQALPAPLVKQIKAEILKPSPIGGVSAARTVEVYGPATRTALEKASLGPASQSLRASGAWYLLVLRGHFVGNVPVPQGAKQPHARIAMVLWSPKSAAKAFSFADRLPHAVSDLKGPTTIHLS
jgi:hypothetical protein